MGEETGSLDSTLNSIADSMEFESNMAIDKMVATLEPVLIVVMAIIEDFIMVTATDAGLMVPADATGVIL